MEGYILLLAAFATITGSLYVGYRIGRNGSTRGAGGCSNSETGSGDTVSKRTAENAQRALESIEQSNRETAEVLQKMRDLINSHRISGNGDNNISEGN